MKTCANCGKELTAAQKRFCRVKCAIEHRRKEECQPWRGSCRGRTPGKPLGANASI
jgi:hypothetical protein